VAITGALVLLIAVNAGILPVPAPRRPMLVLLLAQVYVVPAPVLPVIVTAVVVVPLHTVWFAIAFTVGVGFTVMVNVIGTPGQPVADDGVTVMVAVTGAPVMFVAMKLGILPVPAPPKPIDGVLLVHTKNTPGIEVVKFTAAVAVALHTSWLPGYGGSMTGVGFTVIVNVIGVPVQVTPPLL